MAKAKPDTDKRLARVLIVDDHPAIREALSLRVSVQPDLTVCGEAADIAEALQIAESASPDVAIIDIGLRNCNGIDLIKKLNARYPQLCTIVWSMYGEDLYAERALRAGAMGYITKDEATAKILDAIRKVLDGKLYLSASMEHKLLKLVRQDGGNSGRSSLASLSDREMEVFRLIGEGRRTQEIAGQLFLSVKTVETYRDRIRQKLDLADGTELARAALHWTLENV